jgi:hypothetical protein
MSGKNTRQPKKVTWFSVNLYCNECKGKKIKLHKPRKSNPIRNENQIYIIIVCTHEEDDKFTSSKDWTSFEYSFILFNVSRRFPVAGGREPGFGGTNIEGSARNLAWILKIS